jgi:hypothetical protein
VLGLLAIEERVRRAGVHVDLLVDAGGGELAAERLDVLLGDRLVVAAKNDCEPPKQKPTVTILVTAVRSRSAAIAASTSCWICAAWVWSTWGM